MASPIWLAYDRPALTLNDISDIVRCDQTRSEVGQVAYTNRLHSVVCHFNNLISSRDDKHLLLKFLDLPKVKN